MPIRMQHVSKQFTALMCSVLLVAGGWQSEAQAQEQKPAAATEEPAPKIPNDQLDSLVAPIALYPDPLLAQVLAASTYPLEVIQLNQWLEKHKDLKDKALADAVQKEGWDPSVQGLAGLPDVVKRLTDDIKWTTDLGNAFLAQQSDVMDAVQRMRKKAKDKGLKSNEQMKVETQTVENKQVIVIQQANPQVVQVPSYDPVVVYGAPPYPYPPIYYPPPPPSGWAVAGGMALSFGVGVAMGAMWSGGWGYNCGWHGGNNDITINNNNNFNRNTNRNTNVSGGNRNNINTGNRNTGGNSWQHNSQHRGGAPYANKATANKYGGTARGDSMSDRQASARQNQGQRGGGQQAGSMDRGGRQQAGSMDRGGGEKVGNRSLSSDAGASSRGGGFGSGGSSGRTSGSSARASSSRGASSMGGSRGGGRRR
jgi:hypothetical protein